MLNTFWHWFVIALVFTSILGCWWLLYWTKGTSTEEEDSTHDTGHVWDHTISELNNPLPRWWLNMFYLTILFALLYLALYPGLGNFAGVLGWTQEKQYAEELAAAEAATADVFARYNAMELDQLIRDPAAMATARRLWGQNCAMCHGSDAQGGKGFPNLVDEDWQWSGGYETVLTTISAGRNAAMPPWAPVLGEEGVPQVIEYVRGLSDLDHDEALAGQGQARFALFCAACHGPQGQGNPALGAPNLTDDYWLYGSDRATLEEGLYQGRYGVMPAFKDKLSASRRQLLAAYVVGLSQTAQGRSGSQP